MRHMARAGACSRLGGQLVHGTTDKPDRLMKYLNTDLDLVSAENLTELAGALEARGVFALYVTQDADGFWSGSRV